MEPKKLSARDRLRLFQTVETLLTSDFNKLVFALNPPSEIMPGNSASQGDRCMVLLKWVESNSGPGLRELDSLLSEIIPEAVNTSPDLVKFSIEGSLKEIKRDELEALVEYLRKRTGDDSITIEFVSEGSINIVLSGSEQGLERLQELFEANEFEQPDIPQVEAVKRISRDSSEARKARLVQALRLYTYARSLDLSSTLARARDFALDHARALARASALARDLDRAHDPARASVLARDLVRDLNLARARARDLAYALDLDRTSDLALDRIRARDLNHCELSGANLSNLDLRRVDLTSADLTHADVTGTRFGENPGLTEADKRDLESRGAIFEEPPTSDVKSSV